jgi:RNA polymerase sigma-70 factor, ECF subfamily
MAARNMDLYLMADVTNAAATDQPLEEALRCFDQWREPLRRYLLCAGASPADADDTTQEAFIRLYRHLGTRGGRSNLGGWMFQVARNILRDERKSARRQRSVPLDDAAQREARLADPAGSPEDSTLREERVRRLHRAIEGLPAQQRECMLLRASGLRYREIGAVLGINTSGVGTLVQRAVARMREDLS